MVRIVIGKQEIKRKFRVQIQEYGNQNNRTSKNLTGTKNIMIYDDEFVIDLKELETELIKTITKYSEDKEKKIKK